MIHIITTGGTIEGLDYIDDGGTTSSNVGIEDFLDKANINFEYTIEGVFKKDSRAITDDDRKLLTSKIKETNAINIFNLVSTHFNLKGKNISIFLPIEKFNEVNTWHLINNIDANYYLPVVKNKELKHIKFEDKTQLKLSKWGIEEPTYGKAINPDNLTL